MAELPPFATWWREQRHAKHYLEHLVERNDGWYDEANQGRRAFAELAWSQVQGSGTMLPLMESLLEDLADFFFELNPLGAEVSRSPLTYPGKGVDRRKLLLRNM